MPQPEIKLSFVSTSLDADTLAQLTRDLGRDIEAEAGVATVAQSAVTAPGTKGDPITIGAIVLAAVSSGGALTALFGILKSYLERQPSIDFTMTRADGTSFTVSAKDIAPDKLEATYKLAERFHGLADK